MLMASNAGTWQVSTPAHQAKQFCVSDQLGTQSAQTNMPRPIFGLMPPSAAEVKIGDEQQLAKKGRCMYWTSKSQQVSAQ